MLWNYFSKGRLNVQCRATRVLLPKKDNVKYRFSNVGRLGNGIYHVCIDYLIIGEIDSRSEY